MREAPERERIKRKVARGVEISRNRRREGVRAPPIKAEVKTMIE